MIRIRCSSPARSTDRRCLRTSDETGNRRPHDRHLDRRSTVSGRGEEFNLRQDIAAANVVMKSGMKVWQVPSTVYKKVTVSLAELQLNVQPCGEIGNYLYQQMVDFNNTFYQFQEWPHGEIWGLGDSPTVGLLLAEVQRTDLYEMVEAPEISYEDMSYHFTGKNRKIRVYHDPNAELTLRDFFAKLKLNYGM